MILKLNLDRPHKVICRLSDDFTKILLNDFKRKRFSLSSCVPVYVDQPPAQQPEAPNNNGGGSVIPDSLKKIPPKITTLPPARIPKIEKPTPIIPKLKPGVITPTPKPRVPIPTPPIPKPLIIKTGALR